MFTATEVGERLGVTRVTIGRWIDAGEFPNAQRVGHFRIPESDIVAFEERRRVKAAPPPSAPPAE